MTVEEAMKEIRKDKDFFSQSGGGVTFSGGEPLLQHEFLLSLLNACRFEGIHTTVDTTGFTSSAILKSVAEYTDLFLYDLKTLDDVRHQEFTGVSNQIVLQNLKLLADWNKNVIVRIPLIPTMNDNDASIQALGAFVGSLKTIQAIHLLPYHRSGIDKYQRIGLVYTLDSLEQPTQELLQSAERMLQEYVPQVTIGG
jgi:pyruvate formate lyase activating enzyme